MKFDLDSIASEREKLTDFARMIEQEPVKPEALKFLSEHFTPKSLELATTVFVNNEIIELCESSIDSIGDDVAFKDVKLGGTELIFLETPIIIEGGYTKEVNFIFVKVSSQGEQLMFMSFENARGVNGCFTADPDITIGRLGEGNYIQDNPKTALGRERSLRNYTKIIKYYLAICSWRSSKIIVNEPHEVSRGFRKRAGNQDSKVNVIRLRRKEYSNKESVETGRHYSYRFLVRGFFRRQWYPSLQTHKLIFVDSFVKGPKDAEFRIKDQIHLVVK